MIELLKQDGMWVAHFKGDQEIFDLFGSYVLPTPFTDSIYSSEVLESIQKNNPGKTVTIK